MKKRILKIIKISILIIFPLAHLSNVNAMENNPQMMAECIVFNNHNLPSIIYKHLINFAKENPTENCKVLSLPLTNKRLFFVLKDDILDAKAAQAAYLLSKKILVFAPNGLNNQIEQERIPFSKALLEDQKSKKFNLTNFQNFDWNFKGWNIITLNPECFFKSVFPFHIFGITTRADLNKFFNNERQNSPNQDPYGLEKVLSGERFHKRQDSMFIFFRSWSYDLKKFEYKYGEFGPLNTLDNRTLFDYLIDDFSTWRCEHVMEWDAEGCQFVYIIDK